MTYESQKYRRRSTRLKDGDYSRSGGYFVTVCTFHRTSLFGKIVNGRMELNDFGRIVENEWFKSSLIRREIELDAFQIMPNHLHGIIFIQENFNKLISGDSVGANGRSPLQMKPKSLSSFISGFKSSVTKQINMLQGTPGQNIWQRNFYDRIIRNDDELHKIQEYIVNNPLKWELDKDNPMNWNEVS